MAEYFIERGLPVPRELSQNPLTNWRKLLGIGLTLLVIYVGLRITDIDVSHANPDFAPRVVGQLFDWDTRILTPQNEFETFWDTAEGRMTPEPNRPAKKKPGLLGQYLLGDPRFDEEEPMPPEARMPRETRPPV